MNERDNLLTILACGRCVASVCKVCASSLYQVVDGSYDARRE